MGKLYVDAVEMQKRTIIGVCTDGDDEVILAGTTISSMAIDFKKDYQKYSDYYDLHFIFDDYIPAINFYTVPQIDIIAIDSIGGYIGGIGQSFDIDNDAPICYINKELDCFIIAKNGKEFLHNIKSWKNNLKPYDKITFYSSKIEAEKKLEFIDLPKGLIGEDVK